MPASLNQVARNRATLTLDFGEGASLTVVYRPGAITPRQLHRTYPEADTPFADLPDAEQRALMEEVTRSLGNCLLDWDLLDNDGQPIPATPEGLQDVDYVVQTVVWKAISEDQRPGKETPPAPVAAVPPAAIPARSVASSTPSRSAKRRVTSFPLSPTGTGI
jgi:hypothetical protein